MADAPKDQDVNQAAPPSEPACETCKGVGMIGGFVNADSGYDGMPCPECSPKGDPSGALRGEPEAVGQDWRRAVALAYGHLWHVNNEPMAPVPLRRPETAAYAARKVLRDLLTNEERGEAINAVRALLASEPPQAASGSRGD